MSMQVYVTLWYLGGIVIGTLCGIGAARDWYRPIIRQLTARNTHLAAQLAKIERGTA